MATVLTNQDYYTCLPDSPPKAIHAIVSSIYAGEIHNNCIDFNEFLDVLQGINMNFEEDDEQKTSNDQNTYNKTRINQYFNDLLILLKSNSTTELNISKFYEYIIQNYTQFTKYSVNKKIEFTASNYIKYLIDSCVTNNNQQSQISVHALMSISEKINIHIEDSDSLDFQDFVTYCFEYVTDSYSETNLKFIYQFICDQQPNKQTEIRTAFFLRMISKYAQNSNTNIADIIKSALDRIISNATSITINNLQSHLKDSDEKQYGKITLQQFKDGLKTAKVTCISSNDIKRIFDLNATNGCMKIDTFIKRFHTLKSDTVITDCGELILNAFGNIVKRYDKSKRKIKKLQRKYKKIFIDKSNEYKTLIEKQEDDIQELNIKLEQQHKIRRVDAKILQKANRVCEIRLKRIKDCDNIINKQRLQITNLETKVRDIEQKMNEAEKSNRILSELKMLKSKYSNLETQKNHFQKLATHHSKQIQSLKQKMKQNMKQKIVKWQWQDNDKSWNVYPENISKQIETLEEKHSMQYTFKTPNFVYDITKQSKDTAFQTNIKTNVCRNVQRIEVTETKMDFDYPDWWSVSSLSSYNDTQYGKAKLVDLGLSHPMSQKIAKKFSETVNGYQIVKIESIENKMLYESYLNERRKLIKLNGEAKLNEKQLWHGTKQDIMKYIQIQGFRKEFNHRAAYGAGNYFAKEASYSVHYSKQNGNGVYKMFLCQVLCGEMCTGSQSYTLTNWPLKNDGLMYDSLVDYAHNPKIIVIHENLRAYPMFVIHFR